MAVVLAAFPGCSSVSLVGMMFSACFSALEGLVLSIYPSSLWGRMIQIIQDVGGGAVVSVIVSLEYP